MTLRQASQALLIFLIALPSGWAFNYENLLYKVHVCPHMPLCPPPMCGPGIKIHECHGKYKQCSQDDSGCDFARCKAGDTGCYFSCEEGTCQQVYKCEEGDCSTAFSYGKCNDPRCNYISVSGTSSSSGGSGSGSGSGSSGSGSGGGSSGSSSSSGSSGSGTSSVVSQAASSGSATTTSESSTAKTWFTVISLVAVALVAAVILANVMLHRKSKKKPDHALTGSLDRRMRLFTRGVPNFSKKKPVDASSYQLEQDDQVV
ncbi:unnamed protein product [Cylindrotheca closterium]|uniref:Uncharacterized protein n=1 Tax=Cylindrotheca closterium TaxID=2856 RepID=A0AAD2PUV4_9STRA|nr:unnamed protein product [Cylindrotheca closterium]